jgi:acyl carrier protein
MSASAKIPTIDEASIRNWLIDSISKKLKVDRSTLRTDLMFDEYGLDSVAAVALSGALGEWLGRDLPGTLLYDYPTIDKLAAHLISTQR